MPRGLRRGWRAPRRSPPALTVSGGVRRRTVLAVQLMISPRARQRSTSGPPGCVELDADRAGRARARRGRSGASRRARSGRRAGARPSPGSWRARPRPRARRSTASATAQVSALPPKVEPCEPLSSTPRDRRRSEHRADRHAGAESLGEGHDVGRHAELLVGEQRAAAAHTGLDLVEDQQQLVPIAERAQRLEVLRLRRDDAALALHRARPSRAIVRGVSIASRAGDVLVDARSGSPAAPARSRRGPFPGRWRRWSPGCGRGRS